MKYIRKYGPFSVYRMKNKKERKNFLDISLSAYQDHSFGWEWGSDNTYQRQPVIHVEVCGFKLLYLELFVEGFEVWIMGFWWLK